MGREGGAASGALDFISAFAGVVRAVACQGRQATVVATWQMLGLPAASNAVVRDLWLHTESTATGQVSALVPSHGGVILTLTTA